MPDFEMLEKVNIYIEFFTLSLGFTYNLARHLPALGLAVLIHHTTSG
jgi:hypothetical protein